MRHPIPKSRAEASNDRPYPYKFCFVVLSLLATLIPLPKADAARVGDKTLGWPGSTLENAPCWGEAQGYGPFDYTTAGSKRLHLVESHHFTPSVEQLVRGKNSKDPGGDLDYTLRAFPNHHRALWSMSRYHLRRLKGLNPEALLRRATTQTGNPPAECYFQRALAFAPEDAIVRVVFGVYLHRRSQLDSALKQYQAAEKTLPNHAELAYNLGLLYLDMGNIETARSYAERAALLGYPLTGLHRKVKEREAQAAKDSTAMQ
ncbi:MAG: hypothetical protein QNJ91_15800 [Gammaproteobacteria bacterium]|nr:hypothetical protein [Gammaproteobacteria bacterium]